MSPETREAMLELIEECGIERAASLMGVSASFLRAMLPTLRDDPSVSYLLGGK